MDLSAGLGLSVDLDLSVDLGLSVDFGLSADFGLPAGLGLPADLELSVGLGLFPDFCSESFLSILAVKLDSAASVKADIVNLCKANQVAFDPGYDMISEGQITN